MCVHICAPLEETGKSMRLTSSFGYPNISSMGIDFVIFFFPLQAAIQVYILFELCNEIDVIR